MSTLRIQSGGSGDPVLLLIHGLGATGDVWRGVEALLPGRWPGRWVIPDLPGHGGSAPLASYTFANLGQALLPAVPATGRLVILGHSLGGVVGLTLAGGGGQPGLAAVVGLGIKVRWTDEELTRARGLAARPNPVYPTRAEAIDRHLKLAGLAGLVPPEAVSDAAVRQTEAGWSAAFDPACFAAGAPDMAALLSASRAPVMLAAGERDPMSPAEHLAALVPHPVILPGLGHNAHVENPAAVVALLESLAGGGDSVSLPNPHPRAP